MPPFTLTFPTGDRYRSSSIDLHVADETTWSFGFPPDAEPMGRTEGDGRCWLETRNSKPGTRR